MIFNTEKKQTKFENIESEIRRLEDLLRLYINQEKEKRKLHTDFSLDKLSVIKSRKQGAVSIIGIVIAITLGLIPTTELTFDDVISYIVVELIFIFVAILLFNRWYQNTALTLGELLAYHDIAITNYEQILEFSIVGTMAKFEGEKESVYEIGNAVILLKDANRLYAIKPYEITSKLWIYTKELEVSSVKSAEILKKSAPIIYKQFLQLNHNKIPIDVRKILCQVFYDNEEYLNLKNNLVSSSKRDQNN